MTLVIDAATTGLKWARVANGSLTGIESVAIRGVEPEAWQLKLGALTPAPERVVVANLAGATFETRFRAWCRREWRLSPEFPMAVAERLGVRNAYARPAALGIDRWLSILAARTTASGPLVIANAGVAFAVDLIDATGLHRGGCVVPGERVMREALHAQTSGIAAAALLDDASTEGAFGVNTAGAVQQGARLALAALIDWAASALEAASGATAGIFVTGVAATDVAPLVTRAAKVVPHLALQGLALLAAEAAP